LKSVKFMQFVTGQRYINSADLQLGLGRVIGDNHRMVKVAFDAVGEERIYAKDSAPLSRFEPQVSDRLKHKDGWVIQIREIKNLNGLNIYLGPKDDGEEGVIPESEITDNISLARPADRLLNAQLDKLKWFDIRREAAEQQMRLLQSDVYGLTGCRTALLPHQLYIAHTVASRHAPRVLLADEVGLGKTIEACLILHQQLLTHRAQRAIIIVPESLVHQWMVELLRRFNLQVSVFDEEKCQEIEASSGFSNPFDAAQLVLLPLEMLVANPLREEQILQVSWDLLVVDEAHHLQWFEGAPDAPDSDSGAVKAYDLVEALAAHIPGVLLLTATPEQLGRRSHFARLRLLDPDRYHDYQQFIDEEAEFEHIADGIEQLIDATDQQHRLDREALTKTLKGHVADEVLKQLNDDLDDDSNKQAIINQLLDQHGTGRVLFRNTRQSVSGFPDRQLHADPLACPEAYQAQEKCTELLAPEICFEAEKADDWLSFDPRVAWLVAKYKSLKPEKLLIIASHASTVLQLEAWLRDQHGIHVAVFHEGMSLIERDQSAAWFADMDNGTNVLLCSEIGSEGRNFQFAHHLLFFDLPGHPDLLEQRIGRLDRIGQTETIEIHVPYLTQTAQEKYFRWFHEGLDLFNQTNPAAHHVYSQFEAELHRPLDQEATDQLVKNSAAMSEDMLVQMHRGRDRLLEYNSCRPTAAAQITAAAQAFEQAEQLQAFMHRVFDLFGVHYEEHRSGSEIIRPTDEMHGYFPHLLADGMTVTFDREVALANETFHYLTWEHPMVTEVLELILTQELGNTAFAVLKDTGLNAGQLFVECRYVVHSTGRQQMQLSRYLPPLNQRFLLAEVGVDVAAKLKESWLDRHQSSAPMNVAVEVLKAKLKVIRKLLRQADEMMEAKLPDIKSQAKKQVNSGLTAEIDRLKQLAAISGQVRDEEINHWQQQLAAAMDAIDKTQPQLDAIRVLVTM